MADISGTTTLTDCLVSGNSANGEGGGLFNDLGHGHADRLHRQRQLRRLRRRPGHYAYGTTTLTNCTVSGNSAAGNGGGVGNDDYGTTTLTNCTVSGNSAGDAAAAWTPTTTARPTLTNCTVSGNTASGNGGGLYVTSDGTATLTDCTVSGNSASSAAAASTTAAAR